MSLFNLRMKMKLKRQKRLAEKARRAETIQKVDQSITRQQERIEKATPKKSSGFAKTLGRYAGGVLDNFAEGGSGSKPKKKKQYSTLYIGGRRVDK